MRSCVRVCRETGIPVRFPGRVCCSSPRIDDASLPEATDAQNINTHTNIIYYGLLNSHENIINIYCIVFLKMFF